MIVIDGTKGSKDEWEEGSGKILGIPLTLGLLKF